MSRIVLKRYDSGEEHIVVGWDRPCASYFWQEFNEEPQVYQLPNGRWRAPGVDGEFVSKDKANEVKWNAAADWEEMIDYAGYIRNELPTMNDLRNSMPVKYQGLLTPPVELALESTVHDPDCGRIRFDMTGKGATAE
jgi:hypothetical protein